MSARSALLYSVRPGTKLKEHCDRNGTSTQHTHLAKVVVYPVRMKIRKAESARAGRFWCGRPCTAPAASTATARTPEVPMSMPSASMGSRGPNL